MTMEFTVKFHKSIGPALLFGQTLSILLLYLRVYNVLGTAFKRLVIIRVVEMLVVFVVVRVLALAVMEVKK